MKKLILGLLIPISVAGSLTLVSCKEKADNKAETTAAKPGADSLAQTNPAPAAAPETSTDTTAATAAAPTAPATGQGQKFGYINSADLLKIMPEAKRAEASLTAYVRNLENQFGSLQTDYQKKVTEFQSQENTMADAVKQLRIKAITDLEQRMQQSQVAGQQQIAAKREQLFKPILDKAEKAVKAVGKENGYDYIFDTSTGSFVYSNEKHDIMPLVKKKLGIK
jgi:outer membrane protein